MMSRDQVLVALTLSVISAIGSAEAQSLTVMPITADLAPGNASSIFTLETSEKEGVAVQARVFRWSQADGADKLEKTEDVLISPPVVTVRAGAPSTLRLVRVAQTPVSGEETYRVLVTEIPDRKKLQAGTVALRVTQSLPVFFAGVDATPGSLSWRIVERNHKLMLEASNAGQKRGKMVNLTVSDGKNQNLLKSSGLDYVLGGQKRVWPIMAPPAGKTLSIKAESNSGPLNASVTVGTGS